jgi:hypothetical protein
MAAAVWDNDASKRLRVQYNVGEVGVYDSDAQTAYASVGSGTWDVKVVFNDTAWNGYYKDHASSTWTDLGGYDFACPLADYDTVQLSSIGGYLARADSILLTSDAGSSPVPGDFNEDGSVDTADYTIWADNYTGSEGTGGTLTTGDANGDGAVDTADYTIWADNYTGSQAVAGMVPEPAGLTLLLGAISILCLFRRR